MSRGAGAGQAARCRRGTPGAKVQAGVAARRQPPVARNHQGQPALAADACHSQGQSAAIRRAVVAEHHPGQATREGSHHGAQIGVPALVGEQP